MATGGPWWVSIPASTTGETKSISVYVFPVRVPAETPK